MNDDSEWLENKQSWINFLTKYKEYEAYVIGEPIRFPCIVKYYEVQEAVKILYCSFFDEEDAKYFLYG